MLRVHPHPLSFTNALVSALGEGTVNFFGWRLWDLCNKYEQADRDDPLYLSILREIAMEIRADFVNFFRDNQHSLDDTGREELYSTLIKNWDYILTLPGISSLGMKPLRYDPAEIVLFF